MPLLMMLCLLLPRYNSRTGDLNLKCDRYPTREENRRWCAEVLGKLVAEARDWEQRHARTA
jgi:hypothetical protein